MSETYELKCGVRQGYTYSSSTNTPRDNKRSVNLALETILEFRNKDKLSDIKFLDNVQNFITKVKTVIDNNSNANAGFRRDFKAPAVSTFTDFIQNMVDILNNYENTTFIIFFQILDEEIRKYHYRGCKFYELTENYEIRKWIASKLDLIKGSPASIIKSNINTLSQKIRNVSQDYNIKGIVDYINSLYSKDAINKFQKVLSDLKAYGESKSPHSNTRLREIIKDGVRSIIFGHYTTLNANVRRDVKLKIEAFWRQFIENTPSISNRLNTKTSGNNINEVKKPKTISRKHTANTEVKQSDYKSSRTKHDNVKHDTKRYKHIKEETFEELVEDEEEDKKAPTQHTGPMIHQKTKMERQDSESLEFYQEPNDNTRQKMAKKISRKKLQTLRKASYNVEAMNVTTAVTTHNTVLNIWIEESTGRLPKAVLDILLNKARKQNTTFAKYTRSPKHNKKHYEVQKSWHGKMYEPKYDKIYKTKRMTKHLSKYDSRYTSRQNRQKPKNSLELHPFKKSVGTIRVELNQTARWSAGTTRAQTFLNVLDVPKLPTNSVKTSKLLGGKRTGAIKKEPAHLRTQNIKLGAIRRRKVNLDPQKQDSEKNIREKQSVKRFEHQSSSDESMTVDQNEVKKDKRTESQVYQKGPSLETDLYVIRKIKNLEKEIEEVKSRMNDKSEAKLSEPKASKVTPEFYENKIESEVEEDAKLRDDKLKITGTANNKTEYFNVNKEIVSKYDAKSDYIENDKSKIEIKDDVKVREFQQNRVLVKSFTDNSEPKQDKIKITDSADSQNQLTTENPYVKNLVSKYKKLMGDLEKSHNKMNFNANVMKVKKNINDFLESTPEKKTKEFLIDSVKDKHYKNKGKQSETISLIPNDILHTKEKAKVTWIANNKTNVMKEDNKSKNDDPTLKIEVKNIIKTTTDIAEVKERNSNFDMMHDGLKMVKNKRDVFNVSVNKKDFKSIAKDKKSLHVFRSDIISNNYQDISKTSKDTRERLTRNELKDNIEVKTGMNVDDLKVRELQQTSLPNILKRKLIKDKPLENRLTDDLKLNRDKIDTKISANNKTGSITNTYVQKLAHKYKQLTGDFEKAAESVSKIGVPLNSKNKLLKIAKDKSINSVKAEDIKTKVNNMNKSIETEKRFRSDVNKITSDQPTEKTKVTGTADNHTDITKTDEKAKTKKETGGKVYQTITVTEQQEIMNEDKKNKTSLKIGVVTTEGTDVRIKIINYRTVDNASKTTSPPTMATAPTSKAATPEALSIPTTIE